MGIRESLNRNPAIGYAIGGLIVVVGAVAIYSQARQFSSQGPGKAYFSIDDGKTFFVDDIVRSAPFDYGGQRAYRAHVFECGGERVVGYLSRYTDATLAALEEAKKYKGTNRPPPNIGLITSAGTSGTELKRPGESKWVNGGDGVQASKIRGFRCPDGSTPEEVSP